MYNQKNDLLEYKQQQPKCQQAPEVTNNCFHVLIVKTPANTKSEGAQ